MPVPRGAKVLKALARPEILIRALLKKWSLGSFEFRLAWEAFDRPWYAHGMYAAARLAERLGYPAVSVVEFGVAHGDGLVAMETLAAQIELLVKVRVQIYGFDNGEGLPAHRDYRDLPYIWRQGFYKMDVPAVRRRFRRAELILGDVTETVPAFLKAAEFPPIGFISFDLDYYSSTQPALRLLDGGDSLYLPRILCYFDDIMSSEQHYSCQDVGELLAIGEFNECATRRHRIRPIYGWKKSLLLEPEWAEAMWAYHRFDHERYSEYIGQPHGDTAFDEK